MPQSDRWNKRQLLIILKMQSRVQAASLQPYHGFSSRPGTRLQLLPRQRDHHAPAGTVTADKLICLRLLCTHQHGHGSGCEFGSKGGRADCARENAGLLTCTSWRAVESCMHVSDDLHFLHSQHLRSACSKSQLEGCCPTRCLLCSAIDSMPDSLQHCFASG